MKNSDTLKKVYIKTWGCQMNEYDSSMIKNILQNTKKYIFVKSPENAEIFILNTCSIRDKAQEKVFHQLGRWKTFKLKNPDIIFAIGGCVASQEGKRLKSRSKFIDIIFGPKTLHKLPNLIKDHYKTKNTIIDINTKYLEKFKKNTILETHRKYSAFVSIMEGCNKFCSFCIVPYTRGKEISRSVEEILQEIKELVKKEIKEIILLGQNVNAFKGLDKNKKICNFTQLLLKINKIKKIKRLRFITSHPIDFTNDLIEVYKKIKILPNFLHLPVQSGSNRILKLMKRGYTIEEYTGIINKIKKIRPNMNISSDFIIGFPGETEEDFQQTLSFIEKINFDSSYSFLYSPRPGTRAKKLKDNTDIKTKKKRLTIIQKKINQQAFQWKRRMLGTKQLVLVEGIFHKKPLQLVGISENNRKIVFLGNLEDIGKLVKIKITEVSYNSFLKGEIIKKTYKNLK